MSLTKLQRVGLVLAYIPVISTIVGAIKIHYYNKSIKEHEQKAREALDVNATTIHEIAQATFKARTYTSAVNIEDVTVWDALYELMPGINILAALDDTHTHYHLSKIQDDLQSLEDLDSYLLRHYNAPENLVEEQRAILLEAFKHLYVRLDAPYFSKMINFDESSLIRREYAQQLAQSMIEAVKDGYDNSGEQLYQEKVNELRQENQSTLDKLNMKRTAQKDMGISDTDKDRNSRYWLSQKVHLLGEGLRPATHLRKKVIAIDAISKQGQEYFASGAISEVLANRYGINVGHFSEGQISKINTCIELIFDLIDKEELRIQDGKHNGHSYEHDQRAQVVLKMVSECIKKIGLGTEDSGKKIFRDTLDAVVNERLITPQRLDKAENATAGSRKRAARDQNMIAKYKNLTGELQRVLEQLPEE